MNRTSRGICVVALGVLLATGVPGQAEEVARSEPQAAPPASAVDMQVKQSPEWADRRCTVVRPIGSHIARTRCYTTAQLEAQRRRAQDIMDNIEDTGIVRR